MKLIKVIVGSLIVGYMLAFGLTLQNHAQVPQLLSGTYYSAKDPDMAPLPFNRHPELPVVEVVKGVFIVDDTSLPDTPEQITSREIRRIAAEQAKAIARDPAAA